MKFHAYGVGLPKTGSTTLSAAFALSGTAHEWSNFRLYPLGKARLQGRLTDRQFWTLAGGRLTRPVVSMDVCTSHHLYADALAHRFPKARFVWTIRDVRQWANSLLDMYVREDCRSEACGLTPLSWNIRYPGRPHTGSEPLNQAPDSIMLTSLIRAWSEHMQRMIQELPAPRTFTVKVHELSNQLPEVSAFIGADSSRLAHIKLPVNARPPGLTFDRWAHSTDWRSAYDLHAAELMHQWFPEEHKVIMGLSTQTGSILNSDSIWSEYVNQTRSVMEFTDPAAKARHKQKLQRYMATSQATLSLIAAQNQRELEHV